MDAKLGNLTTSMCLRMFARYLPIPPSSILDVGCGTGRDLDVLSRIYPDCCGIDYLPEIIESTRAKLPHLHLQVSDMRNTRLKRTFDVIMCIGSGFMYARSKDDISKMLETIAVHAHAGTLLILDVLNGASFSNRGKIKEKIEHELGSLNFTTTAVSLDSLDIHRRLLVRQRTWNIDGKKPVEDCCRYRSFFPNEIKHLLIKKGFRVVGMFDNMELKDTDLSGLKLYVSSIMSL